MEERVLAASKWIQIQASAHEEFLKHKQPASMQLSNNALWEKKWSEDDGAGSTVGSFNALWEEEENEADGGGSAGSSCLIKFRVPVVGTEGLSTQS